MPLAQPVTTCDEATMAPLAGSPGTDTPYSVSMPITRRVVMPGSLGRRPAACSAPRAAGYRYWPVLETVSIDLPLSWPLALVTSVRM
jgi:hypothetical protein